MKRMIEFGALVGVFAIACLTTISLISHQYKGAAIPAGPLRHIALLPLRDWGFGSSVVFQNVVYQIPRTGDNLIQLEQISRTRFGFFQTQSVRKVGTPGQGGCTITQQLGTSQRGHK